MELGTPGQGEDGGERPAAMGFLRLDRRPGEADLADLCTLDGVRRARILET